VVVGAVDAAGIYASYSQGFAHEMTVSAYGTPHCAAVGGGIARWQGASFGKPQCHESPIISDANETI
jgi:hypothetical protein